MSQISFLDFYCEECFLKFDNKYVFDQHFPLVHGKEINGKKEFAIKEENFEKLQQSEKQQFEKPLKVPLSDYVRLRSFSEL